MDPVNHLNHAFWMGFSMTFRSPSRNPASWMVWSCNGACVVNVSSKCRWVALRFQLCQAASDWRFHLHHSVNILSLCVASWMRRTPFFFAVLDAELWLGAARWRSACGMSAECLRNVRNRPSTTRGFGARIIAWFCKVESGECLEFAWFWCSNYCTRRLYFGSTTQSSRSNGGELRASRTMVFSERRPRMRGHFWNMW